MNRLPLFSGTFRIILFWWLVPGAAKLWENKFRQRLNAIRPDWPDALSLLLPANLLSQLSVTCASFCMNNTQPGLSE
jgi:hypothetical protein